MLWVLGFFLSFAGLFVWLELGTMFPRSGGEKVYLEAIYKRPKGLATVFFATQAILLGFTASGCIVFAQKCVIALLDLKFSSDADFLSIMVAAGVEYGRWEPRGIALGVITFVTLIHGFTPKAGLWLMNVRCMHICVSINPFNVVIRP
jgi:solute carrier family 7 (L-type amino acid transporter), member 9/15